MTVSKTADAGAVKPPRPPRKDNGGGTEEVAALQLGELSELLGYSLKRAQLKVFEDFLNCVEPLQLTPAQFSVLLLLDRNPGRNQTEIANDRTMVRPRLMGTDDNGSPFTVNADTAVQDGPGTMRIRLNKVRAQITMPDGLWVQLEAQQGLVNSEKQELDLTGGIRLTADGGYEAHTTTAHFDLAQGTVTGRNPVAGRGPYGTYRARGFELHKDQRQLVFTGGVYMLLRPAEAKQ